MDSTWLQVCREDPDLFVFDHGALKWQNGEVKFPGKVFVPEQDAESAAASCAEDLLKRSEEGPVSLVTATVPQQSTNQQRLVAQVCQKAFQHKQSNDLISCSLYQLFEEAEAVDLLCPSRTRLPMVDVVGQLRPHGVAEIVVSSPEDALTLYQQGLRVAQLYSMGQGAPVALVFCINTCQPGGTGGHQFGVGRLSIITVPGDASALSQFTEGNGAVALATKNTASTLLLRISNSSSQQDFNSDLAAVQLAHQRAAAGSSSSSSQVKPTESVEGMIKGARGKIRTIQKRIAHDDAGDTDVLALRTALQQLDVLKAELYSLKLRRSARFLTVRRRHLEDLGMLAVFNPTTTMSTTRDRAEQKQAMATESRLMAQYDKDKAHVDALKTELQTAVAEYAAVSAGPDHDRLETRVTSLKEDLQSKHKSLKALRQQVKEAVARSQALGEKLSAGDASVLSDSFLGAEQALLLYRRQHEECLAAESASVSAIEAVREEALARLDQNDPEHIKQAELLSATAERDISLARLETKTSECELLLKGLEGTSEEHQKAIEVLQLHHMKVFKQYRRAKDVEARELKQHYCGLLSKLLTSGARSDKVT